MQKLILIQVKQTLINEDLFFYAIMELQFQMIQGCAMQYENKYALVFGQNQKDSNQKDMQRIYKLSHVVLTQVSRLLEINFESNFL